jgi:hypothetical protein
LYVSKWLYPLGLAVGTAKDLGNFAKALMPETSADSPLFKSKDTLNEMLSISHYSKENDELFSMHHGFWGSDGNYVGIGQYGSVDGFTSHFLIVPKENLSVSVLVNTQHAFDLIYGLAPIITGHFYENAASNRIFPDSKILEGKYVNAFNNFHDIANKSLDIWDIENVERGIIKVYANGTKSFYKQIMPYVYQKNEENSDKNFSDKIYFSVDEDTQKIIKFSVFHTDFLAVS